MKRVLVDTSVWSLALRKKEKNESEQRIIDQLSKLIMHFLDDTLALRYTHYPLVIAEL